MHKLVLALLMSTLMAFASQSPNEPAKLAPLLQMAQSLIQKQQFESAEKVLQTAIAAAQQQSAAKWQAVLQNEYGLLLARQGDYLLALEPLQTSLTLYIKEGDQTAAAAVERNLALQYQRLGLLEMAAQHLRSSIQTLGQLNKPCETAFSQLEYGTTLTLLERYAEAEQILLTAQQTLKTCPNQARNYAGSFDRLANLYRQQGNFEKAANHYKSAQQHTPKQAARSRGHLLSNLAQLALDQQDWSQAEAYSQQALQAFTSDHAQDDLLHTQSLQSQAVFHQGDFERAADLARVALDQLDRLFDQQGGSQPARSFLHYRENLLATYLAAQLEQALVADDDKAHITKALQAYERFRTRSLKRARHGVSSHADASPAAQLKIRRYASKLEKASAETYQATLDLLHRELRQAQTQQAKQLRATKLDHDFTVEALQAYLAKEQAVALVYIQGPPGSEEAQGYLMTVTGQGLGVLRIAGDVSQQARHYRAQIMRCNPSQQGLLRYLGEGLHQKLVAPALAQSKAEKLYILAEGQLQLLPFDTLIHVATPEKARPIVYPAALSMIATGETRFDAKDRIVFGNPRYSNDEPSTHPDWPALKHGFWRADEPKLNSAAEANRPNFLKAMDARVSILHASAHATIHDRVPELSALVLATYDQRGHAIAGELFAYEIEQRTCKAPLVVLAACRTADGHWYKGEGIWGLSHAFLAAGSQSVLVSLWDVDDQATSQLMRAFYEALEAGQAPSHALLSAKQHLQKHPVYQHPGYWAAFVLQGDLKLKK